MMKNNKKSKAKIKPTKLKKEDKREEYPVATCLLCGKVTEIQQSHAWRSLMAEMNTYKEKVAMTNRDVMRIHKAKNAQMYALYKLIGQMYKIMTEEQKAKLLSAKQDMRDAVRRGHDILLGKSPEKSSGLGKVSHSPFPLGDDIKKISKRVTKRISW